MLPYPFRLWEPLAPVASACMGWGFQGCGGSQSCLEPTLCPADPAHVLLLQARWEWDRRCGEPGLGDLTELGFALSNGWDRTFSPVLILPRFVLTVLFTRCSQVQPGSVKP